MVTHPDNFLGVGYRAHNGQNKSKKREKEREEREANEGNFPALTGNVTAGTPERNKKMLKTKEGQKEQTLVHTDCRATNAGPTRNPVTVKPS